MIKRETCLAQIRPFYETDLIKIITGIRRCGKSVVLEQVMNKIRKQDFFRKFADYVLVSNARIFSTNSICNYMKSQHVDCSINTITKYLNYLEEAYIIRKIPQFLTKAKRKLNFYVKLYDEDVAFNSIRQPNNRFDITHNLENVVCNELVFMGYNITVFNAGGREIDFSAEKNGKEYLLQVAYSIVEEKAYEREFAVFNTIDNFRKKILITNDDNDFSTSTVQHFS